MSRLKVILVAAIVAGGCDSGSEGQASTLLESTTMADGTDPCAHVVSAELTRTGDGYRVTVTVRSNETGLEKYADAWEVRTTAGDVLGTRVLLHPHVDEQPFTRSLDGMDVPAGLSEVVIAVRDSVVGFCGETMTIAVPA